MMLTLIQTGAIMSEPKDTPWGLSNSSRRVAEGIHFYGTPSHGGYLLTGEAWAAMPAYFKEASFNGLGQGGWFEEDCDAAMVAIVFAERYPHEFPDAAEARRMIAYMHPEELARWDAGER